MNDKRNIKKLFSGKKKHRPYNQLKRIPCGTRPYSINLNFALGIKQEICLKPYSKNLKPSWVIFTAYDCMFAIKHCMNSTKHILPLFVIENPLDGILSPRFKINRFRKQEKIFSRLTLSTLFLDIPNRLDYLLAKNAKSLFKAHPRPISKPMYPLLGGGNTSVFAHL